jgi:tRNA pseudouridine38-40 synthase
MPCFRLIIAYDGTEFVGWQRQATGVSVQAVLEEAASAIDGRPVAVTGAGRTDAGVHALGQVAGLRLARPIEAGTLVRALNAHLPPQVRVIAADEVGPSFHARFDARAKTYRYHLWNGAVLPPFVRGFVWHVPAPELAVSRMDAAARLLEGRHDFAAFQSLGTDVSSSIRTVFSSSVRRIALGDAPGPTAGLADAAGVLVAYEVSGDGFLRHMVRSIVGTLIEVGRGRRDPAWVADVLSSCDRRQAGRTVPAEGLCLVGVAYG